MTSNPDPKSWLRMSSLLSMCSRSVFACECPAMLGRPCDLHFRADRRHCMRLADRPLDREIVVAGEGDPHSHVIAQIDDLAQGAFETTSHGLVDCMPAHTDLHPLRPKGNRHPHAHAHGLCQSALDACFACQPNCAAAVRGRFESPVEQIV